MRVDNRTFECLSKRRDARSIDGCVTSLPRSNLVIVFRFKTKEIIYNWSTPYFCRSKWNSFGLLTARPDATTWEFNCNGGIVGMLFFGGWKSASTQKMKWSRRLTKGKWRATRQPVASWRLHVSGLCAVGLRVETGISSGKILLVSRRNLILILS